MKPNVSVATTRGADVGLGREFRDGGGLRWENITLLESEFTMLSCQTYVAPRHEFESVVVVLVDAGAFVIVVVLVLGGVTAASEA